MSASTCYGILQHDSNKFDYELQNRFYKKRAEKTIAPHKFNFEVVRRSMQIRYIFEMGFFFGVVLIFQYYCLQFTQTWNDLKADIDAQTTYFDEEMADIACDKAEKEAEARHRAMGIPFDKKDANIPECKHKEDKDDKDRRMLRSERFLASRWLKEESTEDPKASSESKE